MRRRLVLLAQEGGRSAAAGAASTGAKLHGAAVAMRQVSPAVIPGVCLLGHHLAFITGRIISSVHPVVADQWCLQLSPVETAVPRAARLPVAIAAQQHADDARWVALLKLLAALPAALGVSGDCSVKLLLLLLRAGLLPLGRQLPVACGDRERGAVQHSLQQLQQGAPVKGLGRKGDQVAAHGGVARKHGQLTLQLLCQVCLERRDGACGAGLLQLVGERQPPGSGEVSTAGYSQQFRS